MAETKKEESKSETKDVNAIDSSSDAKKDNAKDRQSIRDQEAKSDHPGNTKLDMTELATNVGGENLFSAINASDAVKARQHLLNPKKYKKEIKQPNPGKMPNNQDPYPVDLKIEELEVHFPPIKINKVTTPNEGKEATVAAMSVGDHTEKRIVKLENMIATFMRYLFRLGARVPINCQYYGGQTPFAREMKIA